MSFLNNYYEKNPTRREVLGIALPVFVELMLGTLFGMIDMMMLGHIKNTAIAAASIAAVGVTNQPLFLGLSMVQALNVGGTALVSRCVGAKEYDKVQDTFYHVLFLTIFLFALPLSVLGFIFAKDIMLFMGAEADTMAIGLNYFRIIMLGFFFQCLTYSITAVLRGTGNTKTPMKINIISNFCNVIGNFVLIYGLFGIPALGVVGAAISTASCNFLGLVLMVGTLLRGNKVIKIDIHHKFKFDRTIVSNMIKIGVPASLEQLALRLGILMFTKIVTGLGTTIYAVHQISLNILGLSFTPGQAFGISASTLVGKNLGANDPENAQACVKTCVSMGRIIATGAALLLFFGGSTIARLYSNDPEIIKLVGNVLKIIAVVQPFQSSQLIIAGGLRGAGDTIWTLIATFAGILGIRFAFAWFFVHIMDLGLNGAWIAVVLDQLLRSLIINIRFKTGKWKEIKLKS